MGRAPSSSLCLGWETFVRPTVTSVQRWWRRASESPQWIAERVGAALEEPIFERAAIVGNSMGAGSAVMAAAERPELVSGLVLVGPFVRNGATGAVQRIMLRAAMVPLWAASSWKAYMPKLYAGQRPVDFDDHRDRVVASLRLRQVVLTHHPNQPRPRRGVPGNGVRTDADRDG